MVGTCPVLAALFRVVVMLLRITWRPPQPLAPLTLSARQPANHSLPGVATFARLGPLCESAALTLHPLGDPQQHFVHARRLVVERRREKTSRHFVRKALAFANIHM
jgi:hypothetical protein